MGPPSAVDLLNFVESSSVECLNQQPNHTIDNAFKQGLREDDQLYVESDTDEQLLIHIPFKQAVKLHSISIKGPDDGTSPKIVKLFINTPTLGFSEADETPPAQQFDLTEDDVKGEVLQLRFVKFQAVNTLTLFIESNQGDEETTKMSKILLLGFEGTASLTQGDPQELQQLQEKLNKQKA